MNEQKHYGDDRCRAWWCCGCRRGCGGFGWGVFFLVFGGYFLAQDLGYISSGVSIWPVLAVAFGAYLVLRRLAK